MTLYELFKLYLACIPIGLLVALVLVKAGKHNVDQLDYKYGDDEKGE